mmetsp:Transcript_18613/g.40981  ORF Transcript_18613/g.40981 Transcript_18613/m.40981 type:complete len:96 (+) Transcript_18613:427-714(+)
MDAFIYSMIDDILKKDHKTFMKGNNMISTFYRNREDLNMDFTNKNNNTNSDQKQSRKMLRDIIINMFIAGRDTTAQALTWFIHELSQNFEIQNLI